MEWSFFLLLCCYAAAIFVVSIVGGRLSGLGTMTHTRTRW